MSKNQPLMQTDQMSSTAIRQNFLNFFASKGHTIVPSSPIVIKDDPTLLFTNAGMNQFKDYFLGNKTPASKRLADTQKCLRVSGKQNDLEEVGVDTYHHTMFEMLGNWSFGDYFKKEAIAWSWELLTEVYKISKDRLYVTIFEGDMKENLSKDEESLTFWEKWIPADRIIMGSKKDNFWEMGDTGPCGPCTEIHVDCRPDHEILTIQGKTLVNKDHPQVIEIWNNVFIQFNRKRDGTLEPLPARHVDTGMGFERLVRVLQQKQGDYDTGIFTGTISEIENLSGQEYTFDDTKKSIAFRVIADHIRAIAFPIADGQLPSNTGAGYVIRRILRRAVRYYFSHLDVKQPLLFKLVPLIANQFQDVFPELIRQSEFVARVIHEEENNFLRTLDKGLHRIEEIIKAGTESKIDGHSAFELFDTFGFPVDLTRLIAAENNLAVDEKGFEEQMNLQKARSRRAATIDTDDWIVINEGNSKFVGYDTLETKTKVQKYRKTTSQGKESYQFVLEETPFYAESGGQVGDKGILDFSGELINILDTKKENNLIIHYADKFPKQSSATLIAKVDPARREFIEAHHSGTHLLHSALREVLGKHVAQKGSLVNDEHLRFDFSHFTKVTDEELQKVEKIVNEKIRQNIPVIIKQLPKADAVALGAMALFGEKYGDIVRVVIIDPAYSIELCGGTHAGSTGELGMFIIKTETAVGTGLRRIEAVCGKAAEDLVRIQLQELKSIRDQLKNPKELAKAIDQLITEKDALNKSMVRMESRHLLKLRDDLLEKIEKIGNINFIGQIVEVSNTDLLKKLCTSIKEKLDHAVVIVCSETNRKAYVALMIDEKILPLIATDAPAIIKTHIAKLINGGGGGQKTLATAGGQDASKLMEVIEVVRTLFKS